MGFYDSQVRTFQVPFHFIFTLFLFSVAPSKISTFGGIYFHHSEPLENDFSESDYFHQKVIANYDTHCIQRVS